MPGPRPSPKIPPEPRPSIAWTVWYPVPCGSSQGLRKLSSRARRYGSNHAAARTRATPTPPAEASRRAGAPDTTSTPPSITATVIAVPRSGSARKRPQKAAVTRPTGLISSPSVRGVGCRERYAATQIRSASFASSDGWKTAGPISSQRLAPLTVAPTASTATRSAKEAASSVGASGRSGANRRGEVAAELVLVDRLRQLLRGCADQVGLCSPLAEIGGKLSVALVLSEPAEDDVERRVVRGDRAARGRGVRGLGVVDEPHTADLGHLLEPVRHAGKAAQRLGDPFVVDARGPCGGRRGGGVLAVVRAGDARLGRKRIVRRELDPRASPGYVSEPARHDRDVVRLLVLKDPQLGVAVRLERAVAIEMVGLEVQEDGDSRPELVDVLELEARELADDPASAVDAVQLRQRATDVAGDQRAEHDSEQLARRRLPVRARDPEDRVREHPRAELDFAPDGDAALSRGGDERCLGRHPGALDQDVDSLQQRGLLGSEVNFDTSLGEPPDLDVLRPVDGDHAIAPPGQSLRRRQARASEPEHQRPHETRSGRKPGK